MVGSEGRRQSASTASVEPKISDDDQLDSKDMNTPEAPALPSPSKQTEEQENRYPPFTTVLLIMLSLYLAMFLVALVCTLSLYAAVW